MKAIRQRLEALESRAHNPFAVCFIERQDDGSWSFETAGKKKCFRTLEEAEEAYRRIKTPTSTLIEIDFLMEVKTMENKKNPEPVSYFLHEAELWRLERTLKRLFWVLVMTILLLVGTNLAWVLHFLGG